ncbi:hypothetical protein FJMB80055_10410 [Enterobacter hormaechei]|nr:hypothetical protein OIPHN069_29660 [Enterobacter hormaechei subsp. hoffmannii]BDI89262.1 hypothetical protein FJMB80003_30700 [Enterobacter hormaechei]BDI93826.1 hypothetical protein FJMB80004_30380 [Enterobacter hormaechei]BDJ03588.1 hypothetical protein FJMB80007_29650 [Enterobacter hormaechei]BDJ08603.1 hypothetical protein FJMB80008_30680 [Enterobacter hormaechei]
MVNTCSDKNITLSVNFMISKMKKYAKKKEPIGSLFEDGFRPLGLDDFADYPAILITFNGLIARAGV